MSYGTTVRGARLSVHQYILREQTTTVPTRETINFLKTWEELFQLPGFVDRVPTELMTEGKLLRFYEMDQRAGLRPCGIVECLTDHGCGYVVALPDGRISHIGGPCGRILLGTKWAKAKFAFGIEKRKCRRVVAVHEQRALLEKLITEWPDLEHEDTAWARVTLNSFDELPASMRVALESGAMKNRAFMPGCLSGIRPDRRVDILLDRRIPALLNEARRALENVSLSAGELAALRRRLEALPQEVDSLICQLRLFVSQRNLDLLPLLRPLKQAGIRRVEYLPGPPPQFYVER
ncbi:MAG: hypothetical protein J0I77_05565 [Rudaea sp.]|uniref:hypothetical protein n=1 Tax=unclassified Rudaea TaxID=2627037 RepID=UPI0010F9D8A3|nr:MULTISPECIES: hypothetical protein [unclassified Rudaea]MBN8885167.1 hypothetical protein [Rudaea sp.]